MNINILFKYDNELEICIHDFVLSIIKNQIEGEKNK